MYLIKEEGDNRVNGGSNIRKDRSWEVFRTDERFQSAHLQIFFKKML